MLFDVGSRRQRTMTVLENRSFRTWTFGFVPFHQRVFYRSVPYTFIVNSWCNVRVRRPSLVARHSVVDWIKNKTRGQSIDPGRLKCIARIRFACVCNTPPTTATVVFIIICVAYFRIFFFANYINFLLLGSHTSVRP